MKWSFFQEWRLRLYLLCRLCTKASFGFDYSTTRHKIVKDKWKKGIWEMWREATLTSLKKMTQKKPNLELWALRWFFANSLPQILLTRCQRVKSRGSVRLRTWRWSFGLALTKTETDSDSDASSSQDHVTELYMCTWPCWCSRLINPERSPVFYIITWCDVRRTCAEQSSIFGS